MYSFTVRMSMDVIDSDVRICKMTDLDVGGA